MNIKSGKIQKNNKRKFDKVFVLDTNIILTDANQLLTIAEAGKNLIVLPETVIDELDTKKSGFSEINFQAREFGRILSAATVIETKTVGNDKDVTIMSLYVKDVYIDIIAFKDYGLNNIDKSIINDRKIIKVSQFVKDYYKTESILLSNDVMCRTRAISLNVKTDPLNHNKEALSVNYNKIIDNMNSKDFDTMQGKDIRSYDETYSPENFCYQFKATDGSERIGYVVNNKIKFINESLFSVLPVKPLNLGQRFAAAGMQDEDIDVAIIEALAGSGKTLLAISTGMKMVFKGKYDKIVYIRNSVESVDKAEEVGFLSGNDEKFKIYNYPLYDTLEFIAHQNPDLKKKSNIEDAIDDIMERYNIETMWPGSIRGRTISNAYVIIDEIQNFAKSSLQSVLSRLDKDCKVICIGSNRQIDHPYINKYTNGLSTLIRATKENNPEVTIFGTELNKVVRGKITEFAERIFENK